MFFLQKGQKDVINAWGNLCLPTLLLFYLMIDDTKLQLPLSLLGKIGR